LSHAGGPLRLSAPVVENRAEGGPHHRLVLGVERWPGFPPGQFVMLSPGAQGGAERADPLLPRPMAIYRVRGEADRTEVEILYKVTGRGTALLRDAGPGDFVGLVGPLGEGFPSPTPGSVALLVGGGTGIASLYELAAREAERSTVVVLLGARSASDLMGREDFAALPLELAIATEDGSVGERGLVTELLERRLTGPEATVYACGPTPMMRRAAQLAVARGARCLVSLENRMACGFGVCLGCAVPRREGGYGLVCRDGPVFEETAVDWAGVP
jgi:dihydroorotate dehydrogenase electron transfer subunit